MTRFLLATDSVHTTATGCDYLSDRLDGEDTVIALTVISGEETESARDAADALNVATVRFPAAETDRREGDPATTILDAAGDHDADEIVLIASNSTGTTSTIQEVLVDANCPVVVVRPP